MNQTHNTKADRRLADHSFGYVAILAANIIIHCLIAIDFATNFETSEFIAMDPVSSGHWLFVPLWISLVPMYYVTASFLYAPSRIRLVRFRLWFVSALCSLGTIITTNLTVGVFTLIYA